LLLARAAPVVVSANRAEGAQLAEASGYEFLIMDDGLQNSRLAKDVSFAVIDGAAGFGNGLQLPAGPLRTSLKEGFAKADAFILIGQDESGAAKLLPAGKPVFAAQLKADISNLNMNQAYVAFCGLGRPEKFRRTLEENNIKLCGWHAYADHHPYSKADLDRLAAEADRNGARLITTEKDAMRLPAHPALDVLPVKLEWQDADAVRKFLQDRIRK
jgi:tetraacyldisaccharide 4'-kinase